MSLVLIGPTALAVGARHVGGSSLVEIVWRHPRWGYLLVITTLIALLVAGQVEGLMRGFDGDNGPAFGAVGTIVFLLAGSGLIAWFFATWLGPEL